MKTTLIAIGSATIIGAMCVAWRSADVAQEADAARLIVTQKQAALEAECRRAEERLARAQQAETEARAAAAKLQHPVSVGPKPAHPTQKPTLHSQAEFVAWVNTQLAQRGDPATQVKDNARQRIQWAMIDAPFFKARRFSREQIEKFLDLRVDYYAQQQDLQLLVNEGTVAKDDSALAEFKRQKKAEYDTALRDLLGDDAAMKQWTEYTRSETARNIVGGIAGTAVVAGVPFEAGQLEQLVQIMMNARTSSKIGTATFSAFDWNAIDAQARGVLSAAQFMVFTTLDGPDFFGSRFRTQIGEAGRKAILMDQAEAAAKVSKTSGK